jgi:hypothetical protein
LCRNGLLRHFIKGNKRNGRSGGTAWKRSEQLLDGCKEKRCWNLEEKAVDRTAWKTCCERYYGHLARQPDGDEEILNLDTKIPLKQKTLTL